MCRAPGEVKGLPFPTRPSVFTGDSELRGDDRVDEFGLVAFGVPGLLTSCSSMSDDVVCCGCFEVVVSSLVLFDGGGLWLELENEGLFVDFGCGVVALLSLICTLYVIIHIYSIRTIYMLLFYNINVFLNK